MANRRAWPAIQDQSCVSRVCATVILRVVDEVPALHKMPAQILNGRPVQAHGYIRPAHAGRGLPLQLILLPVHDVMEVQDPGIVVILAGKDNLVQVGRVDVGNGMLMGIPAPKAEVQAAHESNAAINQAELLVVCPV